MRVFYYFLFLLILGQGIGLSGPHLTLDQKVGAEYIIVSVGGIAYLIFMDIWTLHDKYDE